MLQVLYWMHAGARATLVRLTPGHGAPRGPFALRAPTRPQPDRLVARDAGQRWTTVTLIVRGLDCLDATPLLDIKPWRD